MQRSVLNILEPLFRLLPKQGSITKTNALSICVIITLVVMLVEIVASYITNSLMLFSDGLHMLSHALSLGISLVAILLAQRKTTGRYPFGWGRIEIIAALVNGFGLALFTLYIFYESIVRLISPVEINVYQTLYVAVIGLVVNLTTAWILNLAGLEDLNTKSAFLHLLADTFSSIAIVIGCVVISYTNWYHIDPILSMAVGIVIAKWSYGLIRDATRILLHRLPDSIDMDQIERNLHQHFIEIIEVRNLKIWQPAAQTTYLTATLVTDQTNFQEVIHFRDQLKCYLKDRYQIDHATLEMLPNPEQKELNTQWSVYPYPSQKAL